MTELREIERLILIGVLCDRDRWAEQPWDSPAIRGRSLGAYRVQVKEARDEGLTRVALAAWIGRSPAAADRKAASRAYKHLEELGLLERCNVWGWSNKTSHLWLTPAGEELAKGLIADQAEEASQQTACRD